MTDHPGWISVGAYRERMFPVADGHVVVVVDDRGCYRTAGASTRPTCDAFRFEPEITAGCASDPSPAAALAAMGSVGRFRTTSLWDALGTAITRQVVRAAQARQMYNRISRTFGVRVARPAGAVPTDGYDAAAAPPWHWMFPGPERILELDDGDFTSVGMAFKRRAMRSAARAYLDSRREWETAAPDALLASLQRTPYVGPWTAAATVADYTNDWSLYAYDDLAVRTWARRALPQIDWADDEPTFSRQWRHLSGRQLASATLLTLAWGDRVGRSNATSGGARRR